LQLNRAERLALIVMLGISMVLLVIRYAQDKQEEISFNVISQETTDASPI